MTTRKNFYINEERENLLKRAQTLSGESRSKTIALALEAYIERETTSVKRST